MSLERFRLGTTSNLAIEAVPRGKRQAEIDEEPARAWVARAGKQAWSRETLLTQPEGRR